MRRFAAELREAGRAEGGRQAGDIWRAVAPAATAAAQGSAAAALSFRWGLPPACRPARPLGGARHADAPRDRGARGHRRPRAAPHGRARRYRPSGHRYPQSLSSACPSLWRSDDHVVAVDERRAPLVAQKRLDVSAAAAHDLARLGGLLGETRVDRAAVQHWLDGGFELPQRGDRVITGAVGSKTRTCRSAVVVIPNESVTL